MNQTILRIASIGLLLLASLPARAQFVFEPQTTNPVVAFCFDPVTGQVINNCNVTLQSITYFTSQQHNHTNPPPPSSALVPSAGNTGTMGLPVNIATTVVGQLESAFVCASFCTVYSNWRDSRSARKYRDVVRTLSLSMVIPVRSAMNLKLAALVLAALASGSALAQQDYGPQFRALPAWPADNRLPADLDGKYVYLDAKAKQMVLAYPENLGQPDFEQNPGVLKVERFDLNTQVEAAFSVTVQRDTRPKSRQFIYSYRVANSKQAKQAIKSFDVIAPQFGGADSMAAPAGWKSAASGSSINAVRASIGQSSGTFMSWYVMGSDKLINPGSMLTGFSVSSALKPGMVVAYARGGRRPALSSEMPEAVLMQTVRVMQMENNSQNVLTVGPKFDATIRADVIARDFEAGIKRFIDAKALDPESQALQEALRMLQGVAAKSTAPMSLRASPKPGLEAELIAAMKLSLGAQLSVPVGRIMY